MKTRAGRVNILQEILLEQKRFWIKVRINPDKVHMNTKIIPVTLILPL